MSATDLGGAAVLIFGVVVAAGELLLTAYLWSLPVGDPDPCRERPSALPDPYEVGSARDPFAVDPERSRR